MLAWWSGLCYCQEWPTSGGGWNVYSIIQEWCGTIEEHVGDECTNILANSNAISFWKASKRLSQKSPPVASRPLSESQKPANRQLQCLSSDHLLNSFLLRCSKGWRAKDLGVHVLPKQEKAQLFVCDLLELRDVLSVKCDNNHSIRNAKTGKLEKRRTVHEPLSMLFLAHSWGVGKNHSQRVLARIEKEGKQLHSIKTTTVNPTRQCVIISIKAARLCYTARNLFIRAEVNQQKVVDAALAYESQSKRIRVG
jgi:hypothetical protein